MKPNARESESIGARPIPTNAAALLLEVVEELPEGMLAVAEPVEDAVPLTSAARRCGFCAKN